MNGLPQRDHHIDPFDKLAAYAGSRGYRLVRQPGTPPGWALLDAEDGEPLYAATTLTDIARYLDE
ncbi:hypothetical protein [Nocardia testacea]|uniref:hypothetical protein n=1 Tax=Nocardia testacea TaxID=248551 RepID=UPI003A849D5A